MKLIYLSSLLLFLVGCASDPIKEYIEVPVFMKVVCEDFGRIEPVRSLPVVFVKARTEDGFNVLGLRGDQYSNLSIVIRDSLRYIGEQNKAIGYYENCISAHNANVPKKEGDPE